MFNQSIGMRPCKTKKKIDGNCTLSNCHGRLLGPFFITCAKTTMQNRTIVVIVARESRTSRRGEALSESVQPVRQGQGLILPLL